MSSRMDSWKEAWILSLKSSMVLSIWVSRDSNVLVVVVDATDDLPDVLEINDVEFGERRGDWPRVETESASLLLIKTFIRERANS